TAHAVRIEFPSTVIRSSGRGWVAGPRSTEPSVIRNRLPWHGQSMVPSATVDTRQCWWVQTAENALNSPAVGWVTTIFSSFRTVPPPTGTSPAGTSSRPPGASGPDVLVTLADPVSPPSAPPPPQAAASAAAPAVTRTVRRVASWVMSALRAMWGGWGGPGERRRDARTPEAADALCIFPPKKPKVKQIRTNTNTPRPRVRLSGRAADT